WKKGRERGFRTANIALKRHVCAVNGVFAVHVMIAGKKVFGVAIIVSTPRFNGTRALLEVHLFDFSQD
ncbi:riboflavin kinase, partial [Pseudoalteromonas sp. S1612]|uniref:riboflavin kinase n=1 Tax=Pseudoalteromonas sp. S1612 TaxID=579507 RepID=UPI0012752E48